jgi:beta-glucosidase
MSFPKGFLWGTATASYQIEGAVHQGGRGETIWDRFCHTPGKIEGGDTGDIACDHYNRFREDVGLMAHLGLKAYRFSIAWARIFPAGKGRHNPEGLDFYQSLVEALQENGIVPMATLYHWDLPQQLQEKGGWENRDTSHYFADYAAYLFERLGDRVGYWITHNEPWVTAFMGHDTGVHAPGLKNRRAALEVSHQLLLSHCEATAIYRQTGRSGKIGIALNLHPIYPHSDSPGDRDAASIADGYINRWFLDPLCRGDYPEDMRELYLKAYDAPSMTQEDLSLFRETQTDFVGVNYYFPYRVRSGPKLGWFDIVPPEKGADTTEMGWEIYPEGMYETLLRLHREYGSPQLFITENGAAFRDEMDANGQLPDDERIRFLESHISQAARAAVDGCSLKGYFVWTLLDNFEWAHGYGKRFGLIHIDYETQRRTPKRSAFWYRDVIAKNGLVP